MNDARITENRPDISANWQTSLMHRDDEVSP
jgi:hypothetical protein